MELPQLTGNMWEGENGIYQNVSLKNICMVGGGVRDVQRVRDGVRDAQRLVQVTERLAQGRLLRQALCRVGSWSQLAWDTRTARPLHRPACLPASPTLPG